MSGECRDTDSNTHIACVLAVAMMLTSAAWIGAVGMGKISFDDIPDLVQVKQGFTPDLQNRSLYDERFKIFTQIYRQMHKLYRTLNS